MIKRFLSTLCALSIACSMFAVSLIEVKASEEENIKVDGSYLTMAESSRGSTKDGITTRGEHLMDGECSITKSGVGRIYVYSATTADHTVDYISAVLYVDRYNEETGKWGQIYFEQVEDRSTYYVSTSKMMMVDRGYYYRVRGTHVAGMTDDKPYDEAVSFTDGIYIG